MPREAEKGFGDFIPEQGFGGGSPKRLLTYSIKYAPSGKIPEGAVFIGYIGLPIRGTRIVAQALLAIPDAPPACFRH